MARLFTCGAEIEVTTPSAVELQISQGTPSRDTSVFRSGLASFKCNSGASNSAEFLQLTGTQVGSGSDLIAISQTTISRAYFNFGAAPGSTVQVMTSGSGPTPTLTGGQGISACLTSTGKLQLFNNVTGAQIGSDSNATLVMDGTTWYRIEISITINAGSQINSCELRLDGVTVASATGLTISISGFMLFGWLLAPGANKSCWIDDVAVNDASGASQNSWPDSGKVVLLLPTADSAVGTSWTDSGGASTNLFDSINNTPPIGIADTIANAGHQIRNAGSATSSYDATMTTYSAAGISSADTINVLVPLINVGAPVSTQAKTGSYGVASNPTITNIAFVKGVSSDFWRGSAAGTYQTGWGWEKGTVTYSPSVTVGTAPVARVTITGGSSSRIAMADFMGIYVDYTPAPAVSDVPDINRRTPRRRTLQRM